MAEAVEAVWGPCEGLVITRYGYGRPCQGIKIVEAAHPVPDAAGEQAAQRILALTEGLTADDLVLCLMSGGASALLTLPAIGLSLADKQRINQELLRCGAHIGGIGRFTDVAGAWRGAAVNLMQQARPRTILQYAISAGAQAKNLLQQLDAFADGARMRKGSEILVTRIKGSAMHGKARKLMPAQHQIGVGLVVTKLNVVAGPERLDQIVFKQ
jgi:hypothetical protein